MRQIKTQKTCVKEGCNLLDAMEQIVEVSEGSLSGTDITIDKLKDYCDNEQIVKEGARRIGFVR